MTEQHDLCCWFAGTFEHVGASDSQPFGDSGVRAFCTHCKKSLAPHTKSCPTCGGELDGETVLDIHNLETALLGPDLVGATTSPGDTSPGGGFADEVPTKEAPNIPSPFAAHSDVETSLVLRPPSVATSAPTSGSSSDPPTRFLRGYDQHIDLPSSSVVGDYEIEAKLGEGAMGVVYGARHVRLGRRVAIKVIAPEMGADPQALARFEREARALASLRHPHIVDVHGFGTLPDGRSYFVMERLDGETVDDRLERGRVSLDEALDVIEQMASALEAAHARGIVHRDLKPSNTFLARRPREPGTAVRLLDFGLAKLTVTDGVERTASGAVIGTALYISPEQARGPNVDGRTDVYALGCIAFELVLGQHPFPDAKTPIAAIAAHLTEPPPEPRSIWPGIPAALDLLLFSMLAKDPSYRPTLAQIRSVVASVRSPLVVAARTKRAATEFVRHDSARARAWFATFVGLLLFLLGVAIGATAISGKNRGGEPPDAPAGSRTGMTVSPIGTPVPTDASPVPNRPTRESSTKE